MPPNDKTKPAPRPDCPRQYHDDYIGRPASRARWPVLLAALGGLLLICAAFHVVSQGGIG
ncbi:MULTISPECIES: hypothetical protein [Asticcacaulis]|uniref:hypothetical protein n=1 Tax=Asticcacaulis TaxID=76890 RepID=UPI001AE31E88|nr:MULTISPECIES: hypothetical protein [Asticcacaulis]MBP2161894.1 hypothetical protein [Asticcacaulis solisilvae]MDR6802944.1 hypothetical protein [Asticcacaulis sp. BE141]